MIFYSCTLNDTNIKCSKSKKARDFEDDFYGDVEDASLEYYIQEAADKVNDTLTGENAVVAVGERRGRRRSGELESLYIVIDGKSHIKSADSIVSQIVSYVPKHILNMYPAFNITMKEITAGEFLENTERNYGGSPIIPARLGLREAMENHDWRKFEYIQNVEISEAEAMACCKKNHLGKDMEAEIKRIFSSKRGMGLPAQYLLVSDLPDNRELMKELLLKSLKAVRRTKGNRFYDETIRVKKEDGGYQISVDSVCDVYPLYKGETIAISLEGCVDSRNEEKKRNQYAARLRRGWARNEMDIENGIKKLLAYMEIYRHDVQTIICTDNAGLNNILKVSEDTPNTMVMVIKDDKCTKKNVSEWLHDKLNGKYNVSKAQIDKLTNKIFSESNDVTWADVAEALEMWKNNRLLDSEEYNGYKKNVKSLVILAKEENVFNFSKKESKAETDAAYHDLESMIGLESVKKTVKQIIDVTEMNRLYESFGLSDMVDMPTMHMVFKGNPGTCKTTIARIIGRIMKEKGILSKGKFFEVGRKDLVGQYLGQTAPKVKAAFEKAMGSILFIDEAYSLVDDRRGLYGDEAINTIIQEMENRRKDMVVIFAGYPDEMDKFINVNPGMKSRIAHHIDFPDYNEEELVQIFEKMVSDNGMKYSEEILDRVRNIIKLSSDEERNSNGRYIRNLFEKFKMNHAERIVKMDKNELNKDVLLTLTTEDCKKEIAQPAVAARKIGFAA